MRHRLFISSRSILLAWAALFAIAYIVERPLLSLTARLLDASWVPTAQLIIECFALAAAGWIAGRGNRFDVLIFLAMLAAWSFGLIPINLPWLFRLLFDSFENSRYLESFFTSLATHAFLIGSLFIGSHLSRAKRNRAREQTVLRIK
jgi:hypothetical protein